MIGCEVEEVRFDRSRIYVEALNSVQNANTWDHNAARHGQDLSTANISCQWAPPKGCINPVHIGHVDLDDQNRRPVSRHDLSCEKASVSSGRHGPPFLLGHSHHGSR